MLCCPASTWMSASLHCLASKMSLFCCPASAWTSTSLRHWASRMSLPHHWDSVRMRTLLKQSLCLSLSPCPCLKSCPCSSPGLVQNPSPCPCPVWSPCPCLDQNPSHCMCPCPCSRPDLGPRLKPKPRIWCHIHTDQRAGDTVSSARSLSPGLSKEDLSSRRECFRGGGGGGGGGSVTPLCPSSCMECAGCTSKTNYMHLLPIWSAVSIRLKGH